jgi:hypothetical protein
MSRLLRISFVLGMALLLTAPVTAQPGRGRGFGRGVGGVPVVVRGMVRMKGTMKITTSSVSC